MSILKPALGFATIVAAFVVGASIFADESRKPDAAKEQALIATLKSGQSADKAIACKQLALHGDKAAVPELEKLLADEHLASWARIALEAIPDPSADEALRNQLERLRGDLLIGVMNSIGVRRDAAAVEPLTAKLTDQNADVASAAAVALGRIGGNPATDSLRQALASVSPKVRSAVAEGCILCAERWMNDGNHEAAADIYDEIRRAELPKPRILEATRGAILARKSEGIPLLVEQLESTDKARFQIALSTARELHGPQITQALAAQLKTAKPQRAVFLLSVLADRDDAGVIPTVLAAAKSGDKLVRAAAIGVIGRLGNESSLTPLLEIAAGPDAELADSAKQALAALQGDQVDAEIVARLDNSDEKSLKVLIELIGQRRIDATAALIQALDHTNTEVRSAAIGALGQTASQKDLPLLIARVTDAKHSAAEESFRALKAACVRMPDRDACAAQLASAMPKAPVATQAKLLEIVAAVGGKKAIEILASAGKSGDELLADTATRMLGQWLNVDAGPVLLDLAKNEPTGKFRTRALRGYIRLARQFATSNGQRAKMCQQALNAATRHEEQKLVLEILALRACAESLQVAIEAAKTPALRDEAEAVATAIAQKLGVKPDDLKDLFTKTTSAPVQLEIIKAEYGAGAVQKDVTVLLQRQAGNVRWIALPSSNYNQSFGGDPVPNVVKQLKVQYRINGKEGRASFAENALVVLPLP
ncbi:MAG: HEAT repeat domain-containing protein [Pirellulales bacterium]|nr:HEAT repeat domain-containing protein [Pirellulales bacterium]